MKIGLIGDYQESVTAHKAIPRALALSSAAVQSSVNFEWLSSETLDTSMLQACSALWCVPASPYKHTENVLRAIEYARVERIPFLGTCGGYQHAALEYARHALGYSDAENTEITPDAAMPLISGLSCTLQDETADIILTEGSEIAEIYGTRMISEEYRCSFGVNSDYLQIFEKSDMIFSGFDVDGDPRTLEIPKHPFFIGTAFQPERSALKGASHPLIIAFLQAAQDA